MSIVARIAAVGCAVAVLAAAGPAAAGPSPAPATTTDPARAAAGWLAGQFIAGNHFDYPPTPGGQPFYWAGLTASGIFALAATKSGGSTIDAAAGYMAAHVESDADLAGAFGGPYDGAVATAALAAIVAGQDPSSFGGHDLIGVLRQDECTTVTTDPKTQQPTQPCVAVGAAKNVYSSVSESLVVLTQARAGAGPSDAAVNYFLSLQCPSGGFTVGVAGGASCSADVDATAYALIALQALGGHATEQDQAATDKAARWLVGQRHAAGYWVAEGGPDVDSTGLAAAALDGVGTDTASSRAWLRTQQVTTGPTLGKGASRGALKYQGSFSPASSIKGTADGVLGMVRGGSLATLSARGAAPGTAVLALPAARASSASVAQGGQVTVTGTGFAAGERVSAVLHSTPVAVGSVAATAAGTAAITFTVPRTLATGSHDVVLTGASGLSSSTPLRVTAASVSPAGAPSGTAGPSRTADQNGVTASTCDAAQLACTGRDGRQTRAEAGLGAGLVLLGTLAVYLGRRRRS